jgi:uncharacterized protein (DUF736 family)
MEQKINSGAIFKNDKKTADNQPDYRGKINVEGKEFEISLWVKESKLVNKKYFSAAIKEPWVAPAPAPAPVLQNTSDKIKAADELFEDDLPF